MFKQPLCNYAQHLVFPTHSLKNYLLQLVDKRNSKLLLTVVHIQKKTHFCDPDDLRTCLPNDLSHLAHVTSSLKVLHQSSTDLLF